jgi:competence protein ComEA
MRRRPPSPEHAEAVSRRLATLSAELASVRGDAVAGHQHTRIRQQPSAWDGPWTGPWDGPDDAEDGPGVSGAPPASVVPVPGRHASRRLVDRVRLAPAHLAVVAVLVALGVGIAAWLVVRGQAEPVPVAPLAPVEEPLADVPSAGADEPGALAGTGAAAAGAPTGGVASGGATPPAAELTVDVAGKVRRPGIAVLPAGSRVVDALEAAGGARRGVDSPRSTLRVRWSTASRSWSGPPRRPASRRPSGTPAPRRRPARWSTSTPPTVRRWRPCPAWDP